MFDHKQIKNDVLWNSFNSETSLNDWNRPPSTLSKPSLQIYSSPSFNSAWNLSDDNNQSDDDTASVATIIRCQEKKRSTQRLAPNSFSQTQSTNYLYVDDSPKPFGYKCINNIAPPLPPKTHKLRRISSQPNVQFENNCTAPPRPTARKPSIKNSIKFGTLPSYTPLSKNNYCAQNQSWNQNKVKSASSNEIFKLYQTRDCLGNVIYEL